MDEDAQSKWFLRQKEVEQPGPGRPRVWDDTSFHQWKETVNEHNERDQIQWQPFDEFEVPYLLNKWEEKDINKLWGDKLRDPATGAKIKGGVMCIPKFKGTLEEVVRSTRTGARLERSAKMKDPEDGKLCVQQSDKVLDAERADMEKRMFHNAGDMDDGGHNLVPEFDMCTPEKMNIDNAKFVTEFERDAKRKLHLEEGLEDEIQAAVARSQEGVQSTSKKHNIVEGTVNAAKLDRWHAAKNIEKQLLDSVETMKQDTEDLIKDFDGTVTIEILPEILERKEEAKRQSTAAQELVDAGVKAYIAELTQEEVQTCIEYLEFAEQRMNNLEAGFVASKKTMCFPSRRRQQ